MTGIASKKAANEAPASLCLVAMPFLPALSPSLGLSLLKAELFAAGQKAEVAYPDLALLNIMAREHGTEEAIFDYKLIAASTDIGETVFAAALWDTPKLADASRDAIAELLNAGGKSMDAALVNDSVVRLLELPDFVEPFLNEALESRDWGAYSVIGFSTVFSQTIASLAFAKRLKSRWPHLAILFGGPNVDGEMGLAMMESFDFLDGVLRGEADRTLPQLMKILDGGPWDAGNPMLDAVPGLARRGATGLCQSIDARPVAGLDTLPHPDFSDWFTALRGLPFTEKVAGAVSLPIETSRGCWWGAVRHCVFCGLNPTTMSFRSKSPERAIDEFAALSDMWNVRSFFAVDNIMDMTYFRKVLPKLEGRGYDIFYETKSNLKERHVAQFARAGVRQIQPGIEGLNTTILRLMDKGSKGNHGIELLKWCRMHKVDPLWFYLYGFPNEPAEPYLDDISSMPLLWHLPPPRNPNPIVLDRYSPLYRNREEIGFTRLRPTANAAIYYAGLPDADRLSLAYHFDADPPGEARGRYEINLWQAVMRWRARWEAGAYLTQTVGETMTLILDGRHEGGCRAFLLRGVAHRVNLALRIARNPETIPDTPDCAVGSRDITLAMQAAQYDPVIIGADEAGDTCEAARALIAHNLALPIDDLVLALAVESEPQEVIDPLILRKVTLATPMAAPA